MCVIGPLFYLLYSADFPISFDSTVTTIIVDDTINIGYRLRLSDRTSHRQTYLRAAMLI